ncbi:hypothetical protein VDG1235_4086 [Verrucomicrobiia bacterium DG1235]|nr:hypothetical protein VDG1235_4086 [Verrucomicrobiae bacterium DG1235]
MRKFFVGVFAFLSFMFIGAIGVGLFLSKDFVATREIVVKASPERVYSLIGDLNNWSEWGPWKDADESLEVSLGAKTTGVGASQSWVGADGDGRLVFTEADPSKGIVFDLFFNEDAFSNTSSITFAPVAEGLVVTWEMAGSVEAPIVGGYLARMMPGMVEPMFDDGLSKLKAAAEE